MGGFGVQLPNGIIGWRQLGGGINIMGTTVDTKRQLAIASREWNQKHYPQIVAQFEALPLNQAISFLDRLRLSKRRDHSIRLWLTC